MLELASFFLFSVKVISISSSVVVTALWLCNVVGCDWLLLVTMTTWARFLPNSPMCVSLPDWKGQAGIRACGKRLAGVGRWFGVLLQKHLVLVDKLKA